VRPDAYRLDGNDEALALLDTPPRMDAVRAAASISTRADDLLAGLLEKLASHGIDDIVAVPLGGEAFGVSVVRMLSTSLEDRGPNGNWRPGRRALAALLDR
jgi:ribosomal protein S12 methylthiotransferase accessory factor